MSQVPKFGFSAYLKLVNSNPKPQRRILRERHRPNNGGYDYHKSLRGRVQQIAFDGLSLEAAIASTDQITKMSERESAKRGLQRFFKWREAHPGDLETCSNLIFSSPKGLFKIDFKPDFLLQIGDRRTAVHLWNTQHELSGNLARAALCSVAARYPVEDRPDDFAVLSLQDGSLYRRSDADMETAELGEMLLDLLDKQVKAARSELGLPAVIEHEEILPRL